MKTRILVAVTALAATCLAAQTSIDFKLKEGTSYNHKIEATLELSGMTANMTATLATTVKKVTDTSTQLSTEYKDLHVDLEGQEIAASVSTENVTLGPAHEVQKVEGGVDGTDLMQWAIAAWFIPPPVKELTPGYKYTVDVPKSDAAPPLHYEGNYVGTEDLDGKPTYKFKTTFKLGDDGGFSGSQMVWVNSAGIPAKISSEFKQMDVPIANAKADGTMTLTLVP